ncbi:MAG: radical SAM protein [Synergistales bacterium]|nr:radical SAM protein [Synergistales bacterium]
MHTFGPVPSRRLGRSLGINNVPAKVCSYSCVYCQLGQIGRLIAHREAFYQPEDIYKDAAAALERAADAREEVDYLAFVPDGEPTLDSNLGQTARLLKRLGTPIAIITNGSMLSGEAVRDDLASFDWICVKADAATEEVWKRVDRPHPELDFAGVVDGLRLLAKHFEGKLYTESMLIAGYNDDEAHITALADRIAGLPLAGSYLAVPTRPPAVEGITPAPDTALAAAYDLFRKRDIDVEMLTGYEGNRFARTGDPAADLLSITAVHPMREEAMEAFLRNNAGADTALQQLLDRDELVRTTWNGKDYYLRNLRHLRDR